MKGRYLFLILFAMSRLVFGQTEAEDYKKTQLKNEDLINVELKSQFVSYDFSKLWTQTENQYVYGFIGDNYQRIRVKIIKVTKQPNSSDTYDVYGKSMVKNNIDEFHGTMTITNIRKYIVTLLGVDDEFKNKGFKGSFSMVGDYMFSENKDQMHSGIFKGTFRSDFYLDKNGKEHYNDIDNYSDRYNNNQFVGQWSQYDGKIIKRCNWGDFRIPNSGDFDIGAGEISPDDKYLKYGWQNLREIVISSSSASKATKSESTVWWK